MLPKYLSSNQFHKVTVWKGHAYVLWCEQQRECFLTGRQKTLLGGLSEVNRNRYVLGKVSNNMEWICQFSF